MSEYLVKKYNAETRKLSEEEGGGYLAEVPKLPGCMADGETEEAALELLEDAIDAWIEVATSKGVSIPKP